MPALPAFLPAHHLVRPPGVVPTTTALLLHGVLGSGRNLRTFAQALCAQVPGLQCVLVDLRGHGDSAGAPPPHTLQACAEDLTRLARHLGLTPQAVIGHSLGGKVALVYARLRPPGLRQVWVLDATPEPGTVAAQRTGVAAVLQAVAAVPMPQPDRAALVTALRARGASEAIAQWLTTQVKPLADGVTWKFDLPAVHELLASYAGEDLWPLLREPPPGVAIDFVRALREARWTPEILAQFATLPAAVTLHALDAGHWLHVDDLPGLVRVCVPSLLALA